jgi:transposase
VTRKLVQTFKVKLDTLFYDTTNFFTYIASDNQRSRLAQRGHSKQRRSDLRQFSLALLVSRREQLPLCSRVYEGNRPDVAVFTESLTQMRHRLEELLGQLQGLTLVYDKGNSCRQNQALVDETGFHYVASLVPSNHAELMAIPASRYRPLNKGRLAGLPVYRFQRQFWGAERTLLLLISPKLREGQLRGLQQQLDKRLAALQEWQQTLAKPGSGPRSAAAAAKRIKTLTQGQYLDQVLRVEYDARRRGAERLRWSVDQEAIDHLYQEVFGKRILITDQHDWSTEEIITAYNGQSRVEDSFRQLKCPEHLAVRPQYHWTDQKVRVHTFICLLALLLARLLECKARELGYQGALSSLLETLANIRLAMILHPTAKKGASPRCQWTLEDSDKQTLELFRQLVPKTAPFVYTP